jgi:hypothetical protein
MTRISFNGGRVLSIKYNERGLSGGESVHIFLYLYYHKRSNYQDYPINLFNPDTILCLSQSKTWISNVIWRCLLYVRC